MHLEIPEHVLRVGNPIGPLMLHCSSSQAETGLRARVRNAKPQLSALHSCQPQHQWVFEVGYPPWYEVQLRGFQPNKAGTILESSLTYNTQPHASR